MTIMSLILIIVVISAVVYLLRFIQVPAPFGWIIPLIIVLLLIFFLFQLIGIGGGMGLNTKIG
jgi:Flp pilus assembly protein protease CpaA